MMSKEKVDAIYKVNEEGIYGFFGEHRYLSNFHKATIVDGDGREWETTEHYYQAHKTLDTDLQEECRNLPLGKVKRWGRAVELREDWESGAKDKVMYEALRYKFTQHEDLKQKLFDTGDLYLEETNWWKDTYWGVYEGRGINMLGNMLVMLRTSLKMDEILHD